MLPAILGYAASALAPTIGMNAMLAGAIGSGIGSLLQGGTTEDALGAAALGGLGAGLGQSLGGTSKALGGDPSVFAGTNATTQLGSAGPISAPNAALTSNMSTPTFGSNLSVGPLGSNVAAGPSLTNPDFGLTNFAGAPAIGAGLGASFALPPPMKKEEDNFTAPRGAPISGKINRPRDDYRPGKDEEFDYGFLPNFQEGGLVNLGDSMMPEGEMNDKELINAAVDAIKGESENAEMILGQFLAKFGEDALRDLVDKVQSGVFDENAGEADGMVKGMGDGMDDMIPASMTDSDQDVLLSDGEFVVPADVVSGLGNGSSDAGADKLEDMMDRVRELRTGGKAQPPDIPDEMMLPA